MDFLGKAAADQDVRLTVWHGREDVSHPATMPVF
jgi:hypothetical protein